MKTWFMRLSKRVDDFTDRYLTPGQERLLKVAIATAAFIAFVLYVLHQEHVL